MNKACGKLQREYGFTLAELLLVVMIIVIIGAVGTSAVLRAQKSMEQLKYDRIAENLYNAAQNQLSQRSLMYGGNTAAIVPIAAPGEEPVANYEVNGHRLYCVSSEDKALASRILPESSFGLGTRGGSWIVEYEPETYTVYSVFYSDLSQSELEDAYAHNNPELRADAETRRAVSDGRIGYYSGELADAVTKRVGRLSLSFEIENGEELAVVVQCKSADLSLFAQKDVTLTVDVQNEAGAIRRWTRSVRVNDIMPTRIVLDSMESGKSFRDQLCGGETADWKIVSGDGLIPGERIKVNVTATSPDGAFLEAKASGEANSLFADSSDVSEGVYYARVACGRHLQNLNTAMSGFDAAAFGASAVKAEQTADIDFGPNSDWRKAYGDGRAFVPIVNDKLTSFLSHFCSIRYLTVNAQGDAGLFASFGGTELKQIVLEDPVVRGAGSVGGLAGTITGEATIDSCRVYMTSERIGEEKTAGRGTAAAVDWMTGGALAGGLAGRAQGTLTVRDSFAATVVKGGAFAGGLVGSAETLTVSGSYADCYVGAHTLGGLAGSCGAASEFTTCYSAGFALDPAGGKTAAGFVPSSAALNNCYSVFCFDDPMKADAGFPAAAPDMTKFLLTAGGTRTNAYAGLSGSELNNKAKNGKLSGFAAADADADANPYGLFGEGLGHLAMTTWEYPTLPLPRYNDFYCAPENPVNLYCVVLKNEAGKAAVEGPESYGVASMRTADGKNTISAKASTRYALSQVFVGWFDSDTLNDLRSHPKDWALEIDRYGVGADGWYVNEEDGRLASVHGRNALNVPEPKKTNETIELSQKAAEDKKIYAVYREAQTYEIRIWYTRFLAERFIGDEGKLTDEEKLKAENYLNGGSIYQPIIYMVNPILERGKGGVHTFQLADIAGYSLVTDAALNSSYNGKTGHVEPFWGFEEKSGSYKPFSAPEQAKCALQGDAAHGYTLTVRIDKPCAYGVLYDADLVEFDATFVFDSTANGLGTYQKDSLNANAEAIQKKLKEQPYAAYSREKDTFYRATVHMAYPENVTVWPDLSTLRFEGFRLVDAENTVVTAVKKSGELVKEKPLTVYYARERYTLGFNLDNGIYYGEPNAEGKQGTLNVLEQREISYNEPLKDYFPKRKPDDGTGTKTAGLYRKGYTLLGWYLYPAELYGTDEGEKKAVYVSVEELENEAAKMPPYHTVAKANWVADEYVKKLRLEIYVQDVLDDKNKTEGRSYALYNTYSIVKDDEKDEKIKINEFCKSDDNELLRAVYAAQDCDVAVPIEDGVRSYLDKGNGTMKCPQLTLDTSVAESSLKGNGAAKYELEDRGDGAAVFRLFYKRNKITFEFCETTDSDPFLTFDGLYEAPLSHYGYEWPKPAEDDQNQSQYWTAYAGGTGTISNAKLSFLDSFYYDSWITGDARHETTLYFVRHKTGGTYSVSFYLEKISGNPRDGELRALVNQGTGANDFSDEMDDAVTDGGKSRFLAEPNFVERFDSTKPPVWFRIDGDSTAITFTPNDKYSGYTMGHFITDLKDAKYTAWGLFKVWSFDEKLYKNKFHSWRVVQSQPYENDGLANENRTAVRFAPTLEMYNSRNVYRVYFNNVKWGSGTQFVDAYLYGATLNRLPDIKADENTYRPEGLDTTYHFVGWNTRSDGLGEWWDYIGGSGGKTPFAEGSPYSGSKWKEDGTVTAHSTGEPVTMPANNLSVYAVWRTGEVTVNCYSMLAKDGGGKINGFVQKDGEGKYPYESPAVLKSFPGGRIGGQLAALRSSYGLIVYNEIPNILVLGSKYYRFTGWYQASDNDIENGVDPNTLTQRFNESDYVAVSGNTLNLVARWEQIDGWRGYTIECLLHKDTADTDPAKLTKTNRDCGYPDAQAGKPLKVDAPAYGGVHSLDELEGYAPYEAYQSVEKLDDEHSVFTFNYYPGKQWTYTIEYCLTVGGVDVVFKRESGMTPKANYTVNPPEQAGYTKLGSNKPIELTEKSPAGAFRYSLASGTVQPATGTLTWDLAAERPVLLTIGTEEKKLNCLNEGLTIETTVTLASAGGTETVVERRTDDASGSVSTTETPAPGVYTLRVDIVLKRGSDVVGTIYSGGGATVTVTE